AAFSPLGGRRFNELGIVNDGAIAIRDGVSRWVGPIDRLPDRKVPEFDASGKVVLPGFVDSHTHAVFVRTRADEFEWRIQGTPYMDILARGGGILSTVQAVRATTPLRVQSTKRVC